MTMQYVIVQAGGLGTRLKHLTANKPKGIVSVNKLPMIFHLFRKFPKAKFIIIGDYKKEILSSYLDAFSPVDFVVVKASKKGTCSGIREALTFIPRNTPFLVVWSDLVLGEKTHIPENGNCIGLSKSFRCRWSVDREGHFIEKPSTRNGVAGVFLFQDKSVIATVPEKGEFVRFLSSLSAPFTCFPLNTTKEIGTLLSYEKNGTKNSDFVCRPFNKLDVGKDKIIKKPLDAYGREIAAKECGWYQAVEKYHFPFLPYIYAYKPLTMSRIHGNNVSNCTFSDYDKTVIFDRLITEIQALHGNMKQPSIPFDLYSNYYEKTIARIEKVRLLIPQANKPWITINGVKCSNVLFNKERFLSEIVKYLWTDEFCLIHGDLTFSNLIIEEETLKPFMIDPRGYFGDSLVVGDPFYDWGKLYYSVATNYDKFNQRKFVLDCSPSISLEIESNGWESFGDRIIEKSGKNKGAMMLMMAIIWLSLSTYAWDDFDSICGAFYNGLLYYHYFQEAK